MIFEMGNLLKSKKIICVIRNFWMFSSKIKKFELLFLNFYNAYFSSS